VQSRTKRVLIVCNGLKDIAFMALLLPALLKLSSLPLLQLQSTIVMCELSWPTYASLQKDPLSCFAITNRLSTWSTLTHQLSALVTLTSNTLLHKTGRSQGPLSWNSSLVPSIPPMPSWNPLDGCYTMGKPVAPWDIADLCFVFLWFVEDFYLCEAYYLFFMGNSNLFLDDLSVLLPAIACHFDDPFCSYVPP